MTRETKASVSRRQNVHDAILKGHGLACVARGRVVQLGRMSMRDYCAPLLPNRLIIWTPDVRAGAMPEA